MTIEELKQYKKATEIFEKHWAKATGKPLDEATKHHMKYAIEAINEALLLGAVFEKNRQHHCELYDFGKKDEPCNKQCLSCWRMDLDF